MYEMYPEWGPARHRDEPETMTAPTRRRRYWEHEPARELAAVGVRDAEGERPDDN